MNKLFSFVLLVLVFFSIILTSSVVYAQEINVFIDGRKVFFDVPPTKVQERVLVPLRAIFEGLGAIVEYNTASRTIQAVKGHIKVKLTLDSTKAEVNGQERVLDVPAMSLLGRTMVPLRFVGEAFGAKVKWDGPNRSIFIETQNMTVINPTPVPVTSDTVIYSVTHNVNGQVAPGQVITVILIGTTGGKASFDISGIVNNVSMVEKNTGVYEGTYTVKNTDNGNNVFVTGYLSVGSLGATPSQSSVSFNIGKGSTEQEVVIYSLTHNASGILKPGDVLTVNLIGTSGCTGTFDIGSMTGLTMKEIRTGVYEGSYTVRATDSIKDVFITGKLVKGNIASSPYKTTTPISLGNVSTTVSEDIQIRSFTHNATGPLKVGDELKVILVAVPGGTATFDITNFKSNLTMVETQAGVYQGTYRVNTGDSVTNAVVLGRFLKDGKYAPVVQAGTPVILSGISPLVLEVFPGDGTVVETDRPNIYMTFDTQKGSIINTKSVKLIVDGSDISSQLTKTSSFVTYLPQTSLPLNRAIWVELTAKDDSGNQVFHRWSFTINPKKSLISSAYHNAQLPLNQGQKLQVTVLGTSGAQAWFEIPGFKSAVNMTETQTGTYMGEYTVTSADSISGVKLIVHLKNQVQEDLLELEPPVTFDVAGLTAPKVLNPKEGQTLAFPLTLDGYTKPYATLEIKYEYSASLFGSPIMLQGVGGTKRLSADAQGYFSDVYQSSWGSGTKHKITIISTDNSGNVSSPTVINVVEQ